MTGSVKTTSLTSEFPADIWEVIFAVNYHFTGWTPSYIYYHMPLRWFRFYVVKLVDTNERQQAAAKGKPYVPRSELTSKKTEQRNERIDRMLADAGVEDI